MERKMEHKDILQKVKCFCLNAVGLGLEESMKQSWGRGGDGGGCEAESRWGGLERMHQFLLFGSKCVILINLKAGMWGVSKREGEKVFLWQDMKSTL